MTQEELIQKLQSELAEARKAMIGARGWLTQPVQYTKDTGPGIAIILRGDAAAADRLLEAALQEQP